MSDKERVVNSLDRMADAFNGAKSDEFDVVSFPEHYNKGEMDLIEAWSKMYPANEFRAGMQMMTMRYLFRDKDNKVQDLNKAKEFIDRQIKFEEEQEK